MKKSYNAVWISDLHLGTPHLQDTKLLAFLKSLENDDGHGYRVKTLYLNGDIIDITYFNYKIFLSKHRTIIKKFLRIADSDTTEVIYIKGNHEAPIHKDVFVDDDSEFNGIKLRSHYIHHSLNGKKYLVIHGDQFDGIVNMHPILYKLGDAAYSLMHVINNIQNYIRRKLGFAEFSFAHWIKTKAKGAVKFIADFENLIVEYAKKYDVDGVICGHIHVPEDRIIDGIHYLNSGTFCEIASAVMEDEDGNIEVVRFD